MADQDHLLSKLQTLLAALDDQAFEALASKGLLRRAQKDLEKVKPELLPATDAGVPVKVDAFVVTIPESGPAKASCTCPASGICQHILTAALFLKQLPAKGEEGKTGSSGEPLTHASSAREELMKLSLEELERWAGRSTFKAGVNLAAGAPEITIEEQGGVVFRFSLVNAECRFLPGGGLDGMILSGPGRDPRKFAVAAVLLYQNAHGVALPVEQIPPAAMAEAGGAPRSREEVLESARQLLVELVSVGLAHVSEVLQQRFATLSVSALGVNLPRLALALRGLSDEVRMLVNREAQGDKSRLFLLAARTFALCSALGQGGPGVRPDLMGWHRTHYEDAGDLELCGLGAYRWRTASGYEGLTVLFWDERAGAWNSWSEARPRHFATGFDPVVRYNQDGPWPGAPSVARMSKSQCKLMNAKRNQVMRLSSSSNSRLLVTGETPLLDFGDKAFNNWAALLAYSRDTVSRGLLEPKPLQDIVVVRPTDYLTRQFDPIRQTFTWVLADDQGNLMPMVIPFSDIHEPMIRQLEKWDPVSEKAAGLVVRIVRQPGEVSLFPISLLKQKNGKCDVVNIGLDSVPVGPQQPQAPLPASAYEEPDTEDTFPSESEEEPSLRSRDLVELEGALLALAEAGATSAGFLGPGVPQNLSPRLGNSGLRVLAEKAEAVLKQPSGILLLQVRYLILLHDQANIVNVS